MNRNDVSYNLEKIKKATVSSSRTFHHIAKVFEFVIYELDGLKAREAEAPSVYYESRDGEADFNYEDYPPEEEDINASVDLPDVEISESYIDDTNLPLVIAYDGLATPFRVDVEQHEEEGKGKEELPKEEGEKSEAVHPDEPRDSIDRAIDHEIHKIIDEVITSPSVTDRITPGLKEAVAEVEKSREEVKEEIKEIIQEEIKQEEEKNPPYVDPNAEGAGRAIPAVEVKEPAPEVLPPKKQRAPKRLRYAGEENKDSLHKESLARVKENLRKLKKERKKAK